MHGTNGTGKTTIARALIALATARYGKPVHRKMPAWKCCIVYFRKPRIVFLGRYNDGSPSGGMDTVDHYPTALWKAVECAQRDGASLFIERLVTPGLETCQKLHASIGMRFLYIDVPMDECIRGVKARRKQAGNKKPLNPTNLLDKGRASRSWYDRLTAAGVPIERGGRVEVYRKCRVALALYDKATEKLL